MKKSIRFTAVLLSLTFLFCFVGCTKSSLTQPTKQTAIPYSEMKIGLLLPDEGLSGRKTATQLSGIKKAMQTLKLKDEQLLIKTEVTNIEISEDSDLSTTTAVKESATETTTKPQKNETYTDAQGHVFMNAVPITPPAKESALEATASLLADGCNVLIMADEIYDNFSQWVASQRPDIYILQFNGTKAESKNLQPYTLKAYEGFYLAGALAGNLDIENIGFIAGKKDDATKQCINAFSLGLQKYSKASVYAAFTGVDSDLSQERTLTSALIQNQKCTLIAQSVWTALPQAEIKMQNKNANPVSVMGIGYGKNMAKECGKGHLCSILIQLNIYFEQALKMINDGTFTSELFEGGVVEGVIQISPIQIENEKLNPIVKEIEDGLKDNRDIFSNFKPDKHGLASNVTVV